jgi:hypothetical protein
MKVVLPATPRSDPVPAIVVFRGGAYASSSGSGAGSAEWIATQGTWRPTSRPDLTWSFLGIQ